MLLQNSILNKEKMIGRQDSRSPVIFVDDLASAIGEKFPDPWITGNRRTSIAIDAPERSRQRVCGTGEKHTPVLVRVNLENGSLLACFPL